MLGLPLTLGLFLLAWAFPTFPGDEPGLLGFQRLQTSWLDIAAQAVSALGVVSIGLPLILAVSGLLYLLHRRIDALIVLLSLAPLVAGNALKFVVERPRPDYLLVGSNPGSLSFPSGHSMYAFLFGGILIFLVGELVESPLLRRWLQGALVLLILAIGASRVYMGVHWPSDVIGGYLFGGMALLGLIGLRDVLIRSR